MKSHLETLNRVASEVRSSLQRCQLEIIVGTWHDSAVLKVQKRRWTEDPLKSGPSEAGIFFSIWMNEKSVSKDQAFYNIHALRLRSLSAYALQSREFAAAFRSKFIRVKSAWPNVSVAHGPQTLMQGWIALDGAHPEAEMVRLVGLFIPVADVVDDLLDARKNSLTSRQSQRH